MSKIKKIFQNIFIYIYIIIFIHILGKTALSGGVVEYADCTPAEE